jgi:hypothetical protein
MRCALTRLGLSLWVPVHVAQETRHILGDPGVFFLPSSEVHAAFPIDCGLVGDGLREPILTPAVSIAAGARSGQMVSGVHIGAQDGHSEGPLLTCQPELCSGESGIGHEASTSATSLQNGRSRREIVGFGEQRS